MHPHLKLLASNRQRGYFRAETSGDIATVYLYDMIVDSEEEAAWWGGVAPQSFIKSLKDITASTIHLRINSPGGSVFSARAIEQALREHPATVVAHIDGYAASAASFLALAADEIQIAPGAFYMIHKAWTVAYGNSADLTKTADLLDKIDESLVASYAAKTGQDAQQVRDWMAAETWFSAEESVKYGFADKIAEGGPKAKATNWDLSAYSKAPENTESPPEQSHTMGEFAKMFRSLLQESGIFPAEKPANPKDAPQSAPPHLLRKLDVIEHSI